MKFSVISFRLSVENPTLDAQRTHRQLKTEN